ncbi:transcription factor TFIIIB component B'' homolog isoform X2 [Trichomycterus rosablanca]|uniref:transcription factor TFIIIB component B'' homolog isoform X2 n=1 Tax=Trichomycterus rosablanca TaxID=2290929 RepID=UPI002F35556A
MIRRSRISVRPNVRPAGRVPAASRDAAQENKTTADPGNDSGGHAEGPEVSVEITPENKPAPTVPESEPGDPTSQSECSRPAADAPSQSASVASLSMRRKRFSVLPNVSKPRAAPASTKTSSNPPKSPVRTKPTPDVPPDSVQTSSKSPKSPVRTRTTQEVPPEVPPDSVQTSSNPPKSPVRTKPTPDVPPDSVQTSSKSPKSPVRTRTTQEVPPEVPPDSVQTSSNPPKSPVRTKPTPEVPPDSVQTSSNLTKPTPEVPSASTHAPSVTQVSPSTTSKPPKPSVKSRFAPKLPPSSIRNRTRAPKSPVKASPSPESGSKLPPAPHSHSAGDTKSRRPKPSAPTQAGTEVSSDTPDESKSQSANRDAPVGTAESPPRPSSVPESRPENETAVRDESDAAARKEGQRAAQHVPLRMKTLNDPADVIRLARAKKLRDLLKKQLNKEKGKQQKPKVAVKERQKVKDHTKMTMRELIYYLPPTNPMKTHTEDEQQAETVPLPPPSPKPGPTAVPESDVQAAEDEGDEVVEEEEPLVAPRVKVAEDGSLIIDEESLTVQVLRQKGPSMADDRDPIFERGSTTTYSSFRKGTYTKPWSIKETDMFFLAISMVGTDFSMIGQLFPHRARVEIKNKFKKEERANAWRIDKAFKEKRRLDLDFFNSLLEQILKDEEKKRKKTKEASKLDKVPRRAPAVRKRKVNSSISEEDESLSSDAMDGEKENESVRNDGESVAAPRRTKSGVSAKRSKQMNGAAEQVDGENVGKNAAEEPANGLQRSDSAEEQNEGSSTEPAPKESARVRRRQKNKDPQSTPGKICKDSETKDCPTPVREKKGQASDVFIVLEVSEEDDEPDLATIQENILNKPTRSGRIPKLSQHVIRAAASEEEDEDEKETKPLPPLKPRPRAYAGKRGGCSLPRTGRSRLVTLRASGIDEDEDEEEDGANQQERSESASVEEECQVFVPMGLRSVPKVQAEVEETMEELDIPVNDPCDLGISESSSARTHSEHQLDLLVDVIEFLAPDHMEDDVIIVEESSSLVQQEIHEEVVLEMTDPSENAAETDRPIANPVSISSVGASISEPSPQQDVSTGACEPDATPSSAQSDASNVRAPHTRRNRLPKPKPNLSRASRSAPAQQQEARTSHITRRAETAAPCRPEPEEEQEEPRERGSVVVPEGGRSEDDVCVDERKEAHGESKSPGPGSESSVKLPPPVRRCRGPKPKPNLIRGSRTTRPATPTHQSAAEHSKDQAATKTPAQTPAETPAQTPAQTPVKTPAQTPAETSAQTSVGASAEASPDPQTPQEETVITAEPRETETSSTSFTKIPDAHPEELYVAAASSTGAPDDSVFVLSLSEVPYTSTRPEELTTEFQTTPLTSSSAGPDGDRVAPPLPDCSVPLSEEGAMKNGGNTKEGKGRSSQPCQEDSVQNSGVGEPAEHLVKPSPSSELKGSADETEVPAKRRKLPERRTRAQIRPNPVRRKAPHSREERPAPSSDERASAASSGEKSDEASAPTQTSSSCSEQCVRAETLPVQDSSPQGIVGNVVPSETESVESVSAGIKEAGESGAESQPVSQKPPPATGPLTRTGRRPKGFLSFMSTASSRRPSTSTRAPPKPSVSGSRSERRRNTPVPSAPPTQVSEPTSAKTSSTKPSTEEEPTSVAAYFFNDIFTMVEEPDEMD